MIGLFGLFLLCLLFASVMSSRKRAVGNMAIVIKRDVLVWVFYVLTVVALILFSGLRTRYNDTVTYRFGYQLVSINHGIEWKELFVPYGGFDVYQKILKITFGNDPQVLIMFSAVITTVLYMRYIARHATYYTESLYLFLIGPYVFCMAGLKQAIAMAFALCAVDAYESKKWIRTLFFLWIAFAFHPYAICLSCLPLLKRKTFDRNTMLICIIVSIAFLNLDRLFGFVSIIGKDYSNDDWNSYTINPIRVLVESVPIMIAWIGRKRINRYNDKLLNVGINANLISFAFIFLGLFMNPIYLGRMSTYFSILSVIAVPQMLHITFGGGSNGRLLRTVYYCFVTLYFIMDMTKLGSISVFYNLFDHISILSLSGL